jgi:hypothetical protein
MLIEQYDVLEVVHVPPKHAPGILNKEEGGRFEEVFAVQSADILSIRSQQTNLQFPLSLH